MLKGFGQFIARGNVIDLAVAVIIGAAFGAIVTALVKDLITPLIAALIGKPDFSAIAFTINNSRFAIGDFINALVAFVLVAAAVYFFVVLPMNTIMLRTGLKKEDAPLKACSFCLSDIPAPARRCKYCCADVAVA
jgi:large conductance mechanosensitive channel